MKVSTTGPMVAQRRDRLISELQRMGKSEQHDLYLAHKLCIFAKMLTGEIELSALEMIANGDMKGPSE